MRASIFIVLVFLSGQISAQSNTQATTTHLKVLRKAGEFSQKMLVSQNASETTVEFTDTAGEISRNRFTPDMKSFETKYFDVNHKEYMKVDFNHSSNKIISLGLVARSYDLEDPVYDGNGSVFYVFSKILPAEGSTFLFNLLQSKEKRIVKMYLKNIGHETINVKGIPVDALKYETGLVNRLLSFFWPYKYHYWFSAKTREFIRYEGPVGHENSEVIEVK